MKTIYGLFIISLILFVSCNKGNKQNEDIKSTPQAQTNIEPNKRYQIKSGIITYEIANNLMKGKTTQVLYFDDYGEKESRETITEFSMMGQTIKTHKISLAKDGYFYDLDLEKKVGTKMKKIMPQGSEFDISKFSDEMMKEYNITKEGSEEIAGKTCEKISMENKKMNMKGTVFNWKGITLKSDIDMGKIKVQTIATKIEEDASVPSPRFEIPSDIKIEDMDNKMNQMK
ncbi:MAG: hypothetical protein NTX22_03380 [Ignavibacteriales bacterium]|nr:hypothetical protein [Ignavibacteriales bacterium]